MSQENRSFDLQGTNGFSSEWAQAHAQDRENMPWKRLCIEYQCTYLNRQTLDSIRRILDAGCGAGFLARYLERSNGSVSYVGMDLSGTALSLARERFPQRIFLLGDIREIPFSASTFDLAYSRDVVIHHPAPYEAIAELYRVARYVLVRIRTADITTLFTAHYRDKDVLHHFFPLREVIEFVMSLVPRPKFVRYRIHNRHRRAFDQSSFRNSGEFSTYFSTDLLIAKGRFQDSSTCIIDDTDYSIAQRIFRRLTKHRSFLQDDQ